MFLLVLVFTVWMFSQLFENVCLFDKRFTGQQVKEEAILLIILYHFDQLHRHLDITWAVTIESSTLHKASFHAQVAKH